MKKCSFHPVFPRFPLFLLSVTSSLSASFVCFPVSALAVEANWKQSLDEGRKFMLTKQYQPAELSFRDAVKEVKKFKPSDFNERKEAQVICLQSLAEVLQIEDQTQDAVPLYRKSLRLLKNHPIRAGIVNSGKSMSTENLKVVDTEIKLGNIFEADGSYKDAAKYYQSAQLLLTQTNSQNSLKFAQVEYLLGVALFKAGQISDAATLYDHSLNLIMSQDELVGNNFLQNLLADYIDMVLKSERGGRILSSSFQKELLKDSVSADARDHSVGESSFDKSVTSLMLKQPLHTGTVTGTSESNFEARLEEKSPTSISEAPVPSGSPVQPTAHLTSAADTLAAINAQREEFYERMIAIDAKTFGPTHPSMARDLVGLAYIYISEKRFENAKPLLERALKIYQSAYGADPTLVKRAEALLALIDSKEAVGTEEVVDTTYVNLLPRIPNEAKQLEIALRLNYLALLLYSDGKTVDAERLYSYALTSTSNSCGTQNVLTAMCLTDYARVLRSNGKAPDAQKYEKIAAAIITADTVKQSMSALP